MRELRGARVGVAVPSRSRVLASLLLFASSGCVWGPTNGDVVSEDVQSHTISVSGFLSQPVGRVRVEALSPPDQDPFSPTATWVDIGDEVESASVPIGFGYDSLFFWAVSLDMSEIMPQLGDDIWRRGGLLRLRAYDVDTGLRLFTFDDQDCVLDRLGEPVLDVINACQSEDLPVVTLLSDQTVGQPANGYLVRKLNNPAAGPFDASQVNLAVDYYAKFGVSPTTPLQFGEWVERHNLDAADVTEAKYFNGSDLALGRHMHCRHVRACESGEVCDGDPSADCTEILRTACYVTNYGDPGGDPETAFDEMADEHAFATVAMEKYYHDPEATDCSSALASPVPAFDDVRYFVWPHFGTPVDETDEAITSAALDPLQDAQAIPALCVNCHGGTIDTLFGAPRVANSKFLPFDVDAFEYGSDPGTGKGEQLDAFRQLNEIVLDTELEGAADVGAESTIAELIIHWYGGVDGGEALVRSTGSYSDAEPPAGWEAEARLYQEVVAPYCRMCHAAFDEQSFTFADYANFQAAGLGPGNRVCIDHQMPQSRVTAQNLWRSSARMVLVNELEFTGPGGALQRWTNDCAPTIYP